MFKNCQGKGIKFKNRIPQFYIPIKNYFVHTQHLPELIYEVSLKTKIEIKSHLLFIILSLFLSSFSCKDDPLIPKPQAKLTLTVEDVSCTEAWLNLKLENVTLPVNLELKSDTSILKSYTSINSSDTVLYVDSLLPNHPYNVQISSIQHQVFSNELNVTTMDTTSHNFTWQTFEFGTIGSSVFNDVAIINENNIWVVGEIMIADTSANGYTIYNAAHWDGNEWELKRIFFPTVCGSSNLTSYPAKAIFAFDDGQIWISSSGDKIAILENGVQTNKYCLPSNVSMSINRIWGSSGSDLYVVGNGGNIAHYNGSQWTKIESGTALNINDIWGDFNHKTGEWEILAVGGNILQGGESERVILKIEDNNSQMLNSTNANWPLRTLWFKSSKKYYIAGSGIYEKNNIEQNMWENNVYDITSYSINRLQGDNTNNISATGGVGEVIHFNGYSWRSYFDQTKLTGGNYYGVGIKDNMLVSVGQNNSKAVITIGQRIN